ncbi:hypothetical protein DUI87_25080 [Hirundo rustica rustica]|uniref:B30.2/SPRY domain-containing protein n=1 Tax=Hirundo rustica rustica TaxID=333673 RepID=A0A3M0JBB6_HIRRU|nr:hypothetical protein DUI87_25080 [Hirundo rustica rustica]
MAVALQGFSRGKHYWEVEVGDGSNWELGVLTEETWDSLWDRRTSFLEGKALGLKCSQGEFRLPAGELDRNSGCCRVVGVLLDQDHHTLPFFSTKVKQRLASMFLKLSRKLFPFSRLGSAGSGLGIRPMGL